MPFRLGANRIGRLVVGEMPTPWSPADIAKYWWTADAGVTESGGAVSAWVDQVGGLSIDQATGGLQPTLTTSANLNNQNVLNFNGSQWLQRSPISFASNGYSFSCIIVAYNNNGSTGASLVAQSYLGVNGGRFALLKDGGNLVSINQGFASTNPISYETPATTGVKVLAFDYNASVGASRSFYNNLSSATYYGGGNSNQDIIQSTSLIFGAYNDTSTGVTNAIGKWNGDIAEVIWVPSTIIGQNLLNLQTYINTKYNLSV